MLCGVLSDVKCVCPAGELPLHKTLAKKAPLETVIALVRAYPECKNLALECT